MFKSKLAQAVYELLEQTAADDWRRIAEENQELQFAWIRQFALGRIREPGAGKLELLYCALTDEPLIISRVAE